MLVFFPNVSKVFEPEIFDCTRKGVSLREILWARGGEVGVKYWTSCPGPKFDLMFRLQ